MQVHKLLSWDEHLPTPLAMKDAGMMESNGSRAASRSISRRFPTAFSTAKWKPAFCHHALGTPVPASQIPFGTPINTLAAQTIVINAGTPPTISDTSALPAGIVATYVKANNGVIHVIGKVLIPAL